MNHLNDLSKLLRGVALIARKAAGGRYDATQLCVCVYVELRLFSCVYASLALAIPCCDTHHHANILVLQLV